jgi:hypothetical protein
VVELSFASDLSPLARSAQMAEHWRPLARHHNLKLLQQHTEEIIAQLRPLSALQYSIAFASEASRTDDERRANRDGKRALLDMTRRWTAAIDREDSRIINDVARHLKWLAPKYVQARESALTEVSKLRAILGFLGEENDDKELGFRFIPPSERSSNRPSVSWTDVIGSETPAGSVDLSFSESAASQLSAMKARAEADSRSAYAVVWNGVLTTLNAMRENIFSDKSFDDTAIKAGQLPRWKLGRARLFVVGSEAKRRATVLLVSDFRAQQDWDAIGDLSERLGSSEWDAVFAELGSYIRPTERGRVAMIAAAERLLAEATGERAAQIGAFLNRIKATTIDNEPVGIDGIAQVVEDIVESVEDAEDVADAENLLRDGSATIPWAEAKTDLDL